MSESGFVGGRGGDGPLSETAEGLLHRIRYAVSNWPDDVPEEEFNGLSLDLFRFQWTANALYRRWCGALGWTDGRVAALRDWKGIPALPVEAFKWGSVRTAGVTEGVAPQIFRTSGTTGQVPGEHHVHTPELYRLCSVRGFRDRFGVPGDGGAELLALLPGYLERPDSSLVHMVRDLRSAGWRAPGEEVESGFYLDDVEGLFRAVFRSLEAGRRPVLMGVTWALVDAADAWKRAGHPNLSDAVTLIETGGMKGRRKEWVREEVHAHLSGGFGSRRVGGEYGMTELLSQAWSLEGGRYRTPPWMRVRMRRTDDPLSTHTTGTTGGLDVVDLAGIGSCAFLSTQDLARSATGDPHRDFEVLGRFDHAEVRGCNLMVD